MTPRRIVAHTNITLDGFSSGPGGPMQDTWLHEHALREQTAEHFEGLWRGADTIVLGRGNYEGFHAVWPSITEDEGTDARNRDLGHWLEDTEKVVVSRTLRDADATWGNSRVTDDLEGEIKALRDAPGRDVLVLHSVSVIQQLLDAGLVDHLRLVVVPVLVGGGRRLLPENGVESRWTLTGTTVLGHGAVGLDYRFS